MAGGQSDYRRSHLEEIQALRSIVMIWPMTPWCASLAVDFGLASIQIKRALQGATRPRKGTIPPERLSQHRASASLLPVVSGHRALQKEE
jgi:hypothetical protein